jgi:hypothetical protein
MPVIEPILATSPFSNQVLPNGTKPYVQSWNFGQMVGQVSSANPDMPIPDIQTSLNNHIRKIYDRRTWYGLMVRGQIVTQKIFIGGSCQLVAGTNLVTGIGTTWDSSLVGRQFRQGYNTPPYTIIQVDQGNQILALEMPWGGPTTNPSSYFIVQQYYNLGPNIKYIHTAKNLIMAWRLNLGYNQVSLDTIDPWRISTFSPTCLVQLPLGPSGEYLVELWPTPCILQAMPYIAVVQPPNLVADSDTLAPYIRCDILIKFGQADAKVFRGPKMNQYYDAAESNRLRGEAEQELTALALTDENLYRQNLSYEWEQMRMAPMLGGGGAYYAVNHGVSAESAWGDW